MMADEEEIMSIMRRFGWSEALHMPVANDKNKILQHKLEEILKKTSEATNTLSVIVDDLKATKNYLNAVTEQRLQNEQMCGDYRLYLEEERKRIDQLYDEKEKILLATHDANNEKKRSMDLNERLKIRSNQLRQKCDDIQKNIVDCAEQVELKLHENDSEAATNAVAVRDMHLLDEGYRSKGDDDKDDDDSEFEKKECRRRQLMHHAQEYERLLSAKMVEMDTVNGRRRKIRELARISRDERKCLLDDWQNAACCFKFRLFNIGQIARSSQIMKQTSRNTNVEISQRKCFYEEQIRINGTIEMDVRRIKKTSLTLEQSNEKMKRSAQSNRWLMKNDRRTLALLENRLREVRTMYTLVKRKTNSIEDKIQNTLTTNTLLQRKIANMGNRFASSADRIERLKDIMRSERKRWSWIMRERRNAENSLRTVKREIDALKRRSQWMKLQFKKLRLVRYRLECTQRDYDDESNRRKDALYAIIRKVEETKARLANIYGHHISIEFKTKLEKEWNLLNHDLRIKRQIMGSIQDEICRCEVFIKDLKKKKIFYESRAEECEYQRQQIISLKTGGENLLRRVKEENGEKEVVENILRLRANELENDVAESGNYVFSIASRRTDLETALRERLIRSHQCVNVLKIRKKCIREEVSILKRSVERFNARVGQRLKRYEIVTNSVNTEAIDTGMDEDNDDDANDHQHSVTFNRLTIADYKVKLLRKRFSLLKRGDELDEKIRKIEKEIQATENTLFLTNAINGTLKEQVVIVRCNRDDDDGDNKITSEIHKKENLQLEYENLKNLIRKKRRTIPLLSAEIEALKLATTCYRDRQQKFATAESAKRMELFRSEKDIDGQKMKLERADYKLLHEKTSFQSHGNVMALLSREFVRRELRRANKKALARINEFIAKDDRLQSVARDHLMDKGIVLPSTNFSGIVSAFYLDENNIQRSKITH